MVYNKFYDYGDVSSLGSHIIVSQFLLICKFLSVALFCLDSLNMYMVICHHIVLEYLSGCLDVSC